MSSYVEVCMNTSMEQYQEHKRNGESKSIAKAVRYAQEAVKMTLERDPDRARRVDQLSFFLSTQYQTDWKLDILNQAIKHSQEAMNLTPEGNPDRARYLGSLSDRLGRRYEREGKLDDLERAIEYSQDAVHLIPELPEGDQARAGLCNHLSNHLSLRYLREGKLDDLNQAIKHSHDAINLTPQGDPDGPEFLGTLSNHLSKRYHREGKSDDINRAIMYSQNALNLTSAWNPDRARRLNHLGHCFGSRYKREGKLDDFNNAIGCSQAAVSLTLEGNPARAIYFSSLSSHLSERYQREGKLDDLSQAIEYSQVAVSLTPEWNPARASYLHSLSNGFSSRFARQRKPDDLNQAIRYSREVVQLTPEGYPNQALYLGAFNTRLYARCLKEKNVDDLKEIVRYSIEAWESMNNPPFFRLARCREVAYLFTRIHKWQEAKALLDQGFGIFPFLMPHMASKFDRENMMRSISGMAATGCALSLQCHEDVYQTIKILEMGRGTLSRLTINSKTDLSELRQHHPILAKRFEELRSIINSPSHSTADRGRKATPDSSMLTMYSINLLSEIRRSKGFENFQHLPSTDKLLETTDGETKVLLNTTHFRTDAIMINANGCIRTLPLDQSVFDDAKNYYGQLRKRFGYDGISKPSWDTANHDMSEFLKWLWDFIVKPVLDALDLEPSTEIFNQEQFGPEDEFDRIALSRTSPKPGIWSTDRLAILRKLMERYPSLTSSVHTQSRSRSGSHGPKSVNVSNLPRIHWIGVGFLGVFPFHAAGYGSQYPTSNTMSYAMSSYAASLTTLSFAKRKPMTLAAGHSNLLLVTMPDTPGESSLPGVKKEAGIIQEMMSGSIEVKLLEKPVVQTVLKSLPYYDIVHFACHAFADPTSPFRSGLILSGDEPGSGNGTLSVERISSMDLKKPQLAFLSACCTAENASWALLDEGIHLASGFQLTGFPHVIASLWEADDNLSVAMTERFYRTIFDWGGVNGHAKIAYALHEAVRTARQICDEPLLWAPFIHFGP